MPVVCFDLANKTDYSSDFDVQAKFRAGLLAVKLTTILFYSSHHISHFNTLLYKFIHLFVE